MVYNVKVKSFPTGLKQYFGHSKPVFSEYSREPTKEKEIDSARSKSVSKSRSKVNAYDLALANDWDYFLTGTFDRKVVNAYDYACFVDYICLFTQRLRDHGIVYLLVPERHKDGAWHFHALVKGNLPLSPAINPHTGSLLLDSSGRQIYNCTLYKYGFTTVTRITDSIKSAGYICKYLTKAQDDVPKGKKRYWASRSLNRPTEEFIVVDNYSDFVETMKQKADYTKETSTELFGDFFFAEIKK